jgi:hypothetical protein
MVPAVLVSGPVASGKSTLGAALAVRLGAALLDQDVLTGPLTSVVGSLVGSDDLDDPALATPTRAARYESLLATAVDNLRVGRPVVAVAPFTAERADPEAWARVRDRLVAAGGSPLLVWLRIERDELLRPRPSTSRWTRPGRPSGWPGRWRRSCRRAVDVDPSAMVWSSATGLPASALDTAPARPHTSLHRHVTSFTSTSDIVYLAPGQTMPGTLRTGLEDEERAC